MLFTDRLFKETCDSHKQVDRHPFVKKMRENPEDAILYIQFNEKCIYEIQSTLNLKDQTLQKMLHRNVTKLSDSLNITELLDRCKEQPLYHAYMFYLGLLAGGNLLKKYVPSDYIEILIFQEDTKYLIQRFKNYLNETILTEKDQNDFIKAVNISYSLIKECFDLNIN